MIDGLHLELDGEGVERVVEVFHFSDQLHGITFDGRVGRVGSEAQDGRGQTGFEHVDEDRVFPCGGTRIGNRHRDGVGADTECIRCKRGVAFLVWDICGEVSIDRTEPRDGQGVGLALGITGNTDELNRLVRRHVFTVLWAQDVRGGCAVFGGRIRFCFWFRIASNDGGDEHDDRDSHGYLRWVSSPRFGVACNPAA